MSREMSKVLKVVERSQQTLISPPLVGDLGDRMQRLNTLGLKIVEVQVSFKTRKRCFSLEAWAIG